MSTVEKFPQGAPAWVDLQSPDPELSKTFYSALFVACSNIPSILLGLPAGMVVDITVMIGSSWRRTVTSRWIPKCPIRRRSESYTLM